MTADHKRPKIALFGNFGTGNLGNEATLEAMLYNLRRYMPKAEIICICPGPGNTASKYNIPAFPIRARFPYKEILARLGNSGQAKTEGTGLQGPASEAHRWRRFSWLRASIRTLIYPLLAPYRWLKAIARLRGSDMLIMTGTGMLQDFGIRPFSLHYDILAWSIMARLCGCKLLFVSVGAGPIRHPLSRCFVKAALTLAHYRSYRDAFSRNYLEEIAFDVKNDSVYPDLAFSLSRANLPATHDRDGRGAVIGLGLINYHNRLGRSGGDETIYRDYLARLADFVVRLLERKFTVRLLIGDVVYDNPVRQDLRKVLEERGVKREDRRIIDEPASSVDELLPQLASADVVASSRFHNLLLALMLRKPVVAISYSEKFAPLMSGVGLAEFCQDIECIDIGKLIGDVARLQENARSFKPQIARETEAYRLALDEQYRQIFKLSGTVSCGRDMASEHVPTMKSADFVGSESASNFKWR
jgi:polysaccharide pyruvyl transferase WcaK-like protein